MAFSVTPTSGAAPFVYSVEFYARESLLTDAYKLESYLQTTVGSCPAPGTSGTLTNYSESLLATGTYTQVTQGNIIAGSCRTVTLIIREVATGNIISQEFARINNI